MLDVIFEEAADIACVVEIALPEFLGFLLAEVLAQQSAAFGETIGFVCFDEGDILPGRRNAVAEEDDSLGGFESVRGGGFRGVPGMLSLRALSAA